MRARAREETSRTDAPIPNERAAPIISRVTYVALLAPLSLSEYEWGIEGGGGRLLIWEGINEVGRSLGAMRRWKKVEVCVRSSCV